VFKSKKKNLILWLKNFTVEPAIVLKYYPLYSPH